MERAKGFEPSTSTLARLHSTPELRPHPVSKCNLIRNFEEPDDRHFHGLCKYLLYASGSVSKTPENQLFLGVCCAQYVFNLDAQLLEHRHQQHILVFEMV